MIIRLSYLDLKVATTTLDPNLIIITMRDDSRIIWNYVKDSDLTLCFGTRAFMLTNKSKNVEEIYNALTEWIHDKMGCCS
jgi:hypothetical protein